MKKIFPILLLTLLAGISGCNPITTPLIDAPRFHTPLREASEQEFDKRAAEMHEFLKDYDLRGCRVIFESVRRYPIDLLMQACRQFGFNRIYLEIYSEAQFGKELESFLTKAANQGLKVDLVLPQRCFYRRIPGYMLLRYLLPKTPSWPEAGKLTAEYIRTLPENIRPGITALVEMQRFTKGNHYRPEGLICAWNEKSYGIGMDNDLLVQMTRRELHEMQKNVGDIAFTIAVPDFLHDRAYRRELSFGKVTEFAEFSSSGKQVTLVVINTGTKPTELVKNVKEELAEKLPQNMHLAQAVNLASHTSVTRGALRRRNWEDLMHSLNYLKLNSPNIAVVKGNGIVIGPFAMVAFLALEAK